MKGENMEDKLNDKIQKTAELIAGFAKEKFEEDEQKEILKELPTNEDVKENDEVNEENNLDLGI